MTGPSAVPTNCRHQKIQCDVWEEERDLTSGPVVWFMSRFSSAATTLSFICTTWVRCAVKQNVVDDLEWTFGLFHGYKTTEVPDCSLRLESRLGFFPWGSHWISPCFSGWELIHLCFKNASRLSPGWSHSSAECEQCTTGWMSKPGKHWAM